MEIMHWIKSKRNLTILIVWWCLIFGYECASKESEFNSSSISDFNKCDNDKRCPTGLNGNVCSNHGLCNCSTGICQCSPDKIGNACQYQRDMMTCDTLRYCVQCRTYGTGPFADDDSCEIFCNDSPKPLIISKLTLRRNEVLCSFIDSSDNATGCRFYFKLVNLNRNSMVVSPRNQDTVFTGATAKSHNSDANEHDFYIVAKKHHDCDGGGGKRYFPESMSGSSDVYVSSTQELMKQVRDEDAKAINHDERKPEKNYATMLIIFVFIALPFVACIASFINNFMKLPCGLCNIFRRPSSSYLRNVRDYPVENVPDFEDPFFYPERTQNN